MEDLNDFPWILRSNIAHIGTLVRLFDADLCYVGDRLQFLCMDTASISIGDQT